MRSVEFEILLALAGGVRHGYAILQEIEARGEAARAIETGTLYRALQRLVDGELVRLAEAPSAAAEADARRRFYGITPAGRAAAATEARRLATLVAAARSAGLIPERA